MLLGSKASIAEYDLLITLLVGVIVLIVLASFIVTFVLFYSKRKADFQKKVNDLESNFQQEILRTQLEIQEQTLQNISQELHDNIGQILTLIKVNLNKVLLDRSFDENKVNDFKQLIGKAISAVRNISKSISSERINELGLINAVQQELYIIERASELQVKFKSQCNIIRFKPREELILFRIIQETLNNIIKHANASLVQLNIWRDEAFFYIEIKDNGKGFDYKEISTNNNITGGLGLKNISRRAELLDAKLQVTSSNGSGTSVLLTIPAETDD